MGLAGDSIWKARAMTESKETPRFWWLVGPFKEMGQAGDKLRDCSWIVWDHTLAVPHMQAA